MKKLKVNDRKVKFWFKFGPYFETEVEIFVEHTNEDQWNYDVVDYEVGPVLHDEEGLVDVDVIEKHDESDSTTKECESFHDFDYSLEKADMKFDKSINSTIEWVGVTEKSRDNQAKGKNIEHGVTSNMLAMFFNDTQEDDFAASDEELMRLHGDSDDKNHKRSIVFNPTRDLEDPKFKFALHMIFSNSKEFKREVEVHAVIQKKGYQI
ncbi:hypothetical protein RDI58_000668 [Solanum bulbocastanum]|uniref:Uncharacterized protein n=1 Tax=Solanum bulbocastanum TaxID=147425 RepID=A0AAN8U3Q0_SOLBU